MVAMAAPELHFITRAADARFQPADAPPAAPALPLFFNLPAEQAGSADASARSRTEARPAQRVCDRR
jgi:hypothetical protein